MEAGGRADGAADTSGRSGGGSNVARGEFISSLAASVGLGLGLAVTASSPGAAGATVQFETERYGDKELKIATVNKLRQQIRNSVRGVEWMGSERMRGVFALRFRLGICRRWGLHDNVNNVQR